MIGRVAAVVGLTMLAASSCSLDGPGAEQEEPTAAEALRSAGLQLPAGASDATVRVQELSGRTHSWAVTFVAPRTEALSFCDPMGGAGTISAVPSTHADLLGDLDVPAGSQGCQASTTSGERWQRFVLVEPGDPARVQVSLQQFTR